MDVQGLYADPPVDGRDSLLNHVVFILQLALRRASL